MNALNAARQKYYADRRAIFEAQIAERERIRGEEAAKAAADIAAANLKAEEVKEILSANKIKEWWQMWKLRQRAELRKEVPANVDFRTYKYTIEKNLTFDDADLKTWIEKISSKVIELEDKQNQFFTNVGNAEKDAEKQGQGVNIMGMQIGGTGQAQTKLITPELTSPTKEPASKDRRKQLLQEGEDPNAQAKAPAQAKRVDRPKKPLKKSQTV